MSEKEIRSFLSALRKRLDGPLRKVLLPTAVGAGLALGGCSDDNGPKPDGKQTADIGTTDAKQGDQKTIDLPKFPDGLPTPYSAPDVAPLHQHLSTPPAKRA